jgi:hypothetical protein
MSYFYFNYISNAQLHMLLAVTVLHIADLEQKVSLADILSDLLLISHPYTVDILVTLY